MEWNRLLFKFWCEHYSQLRNYELLPFETHYNFLDIPVTGGSKPSISPYEETCDLNWEFDKTLAKLGERGKLFKRVYIDEKEELTKESRATYEEFYKLLIEGEG